MAAILEHTPVPVSTRKPIVSPAPDHVIGKCLAKDTDSRWQTARDLMLELKWAADAQARPLVPVGGSRRTRRALAVAAMAVSPTRRYSMFDFMKAAPSGVFHRWLSPLCSTDGARPPWPQSRKADGRAARARTRTLSVRSSGPSIDPVETLSDSCVMPEIIPDVSVPRARGIRFSRIPSRAAEALCFLGGALTSVQLSLGRHNPPNHIPGPGSRRGLAVQTAAVGVCTSSPALTSVSRSV
jgi:hypothetical protein